MAEQTKTAAPAKAESAPAKLLLAAESGDAGVQNLLAAREIHDRNGDAGGVAAVDAALAGLGFTV